MITLTMRGVHFPGSILSGTVPKAAGGVPLRLPRQQN